MWRLSRSIVVRQSWYIVHRVTAAATDAAVEVHSLMSSPSSIWRNVNVEERKVYTRRRVCHDNHRSRRRHQTISPLQHPQPQQ